MTPVATRRLTINPRITSVMIVAYLAPTPLLTQLVTASALVLLIVLGGVAARVGGASMVRGALRVAFWGALAMAASAGVGRIFGTQVQ